MARLGFKHTSQVQTRDKYTKCDMDLGLTIDGREIPNAAVLGAALEEAVKLIQDRITESYQVVPARPDNTPDNVQVIPQPTQVPQPESAPVPVATYTAGQPAPAGTKVVYEGPAPQPVAAPVNTNPAQGTDGLGFPPGYTPNQS